MSAKVLYEWSKPTPDFVTETISRYGSNPFGEPLFRVVWSGSQTERVWKRTESGRVEEHVLPVYPGVQRWILETWVPPERYGHPIIWERQNRDSNLDLGPFPSRGQYEHSYTLEANGEYLPITLEVLRVICKLIEQSRDLSMAQRRVALQAQEDQKKKAQNDRTRDILEDALGPFGGPTVGAHFRTTRDGSDIKIEHTTASLPKSIRESSGFSQV